jgi:uncharacterized membrane protein
MGVIVGIVNFYYFKKKAWASEIGILSNEEPFHILKFKRVPVRKYF